jgi:hypothetical protein
LNGKHDGWHAADRGMNAFVPLLQPPSPALFIYLRWKYLLFDIYDAKKKLSVVATGDYGKAASILLPTPSTPNQNTPTNSSYCKE